MYLENSYEVLLLCELISNPHNFKLFQISISVPLNTHAINRCFWVFQRSKLVNSWPLKYKIQGTFSKLFYYSFFEVGTNFKCRTSKLFETFVRFISVFPKTF